MRFIGFKEFRLARTIESVIFYLESDFKKMLRELQLGLTRLSFVDNFNAFSVELTFAAGEEKAIRNQLREGDVPTQRIIVRGGTDAYSIVDGDTAWDSNYLYLKNTAATAVTVTVVFLK